LSATPLPSSLSRALPQPHAIATFNELTQEGRPVAAALVSLSPMTRDDACLYTNERIDSPADRRLARALERDYSADEALRLLTDGGAGGAPAAAAAAAADERAPAAPPAARRAPAASPAPAYGVSGALPADVSLVDAAEARRLASVLARPSSEAERREAGTRRGARRSSREQAIPDDPSKR